MADFYRSERPWLVRFFQRRLNSVEDASDLAQEALLRFFRAAPGTAIEKPQVYLHQIALNLIRDRAERGSTRLAQQSRPLHEGLDHPSDVSQHRELEGREAIARWQTILAKLKPRTMEIFLLSRVEGYTYREIAEKLEIPYWVVERAMVKAIRHVVAHREITDD